jgi:uncharacterized Rmd1/YagE family protein
LDCTAATVLFVAFRRLRDHSNNAHTSRLEWVVIWLIIIEVGGRPPLLLFAC